MPQYVLALDQGTTSSRAILFDHDGRPCAFPPARNSSSIIHNRAGWNTMPQKFGSRSTQ